MVVIQEVWGVNTWVRSVADRFARHGYLVAVQDCRGRFDSEGEWYAWGLEAEDGFDTQEWLGAQPQCAGFGTSSVTGPGRSDSTASRVRGSSSDRAASTAST